MSSPTDGFTLQTWVFFITYKKRGVATKYFVSKSSNNDADSFTVIENFRKIAVRNPNFTDISPVQFYTY